MDFLIQVPIEKHFKSIKILPISQMHKRIDSENLIVYVDETKTKVINKNRKRTYIFIGDIVRPAHYEDDVTFYNHLTDNFTPQSIRYIDGHFYLIEINERALFVFNGIFSILPIYYYVDDSFIYIASKSTLIKNYCDMSTTLDKRFLLEKILFNYPFFNSTYYLNINMVPANAYLYIEKGLKVIKHTDIKEFFVENPKPYKNAKEILHDIFLTIVKDYIPRDRFAIAFTDGFDTRTILACVKKYTNSFYTYSYGTEQCSDIIIPRYISKKLNLQYKPLLINDQYVKNYSLKDGLEFIELTDGNGALNRSHYIYLARTLSQDRNYILTGNFGSELLRPFHEMPITGLIISKELISIFKYKDKDMWINELQHSERLNFLNKHVFKHEFEALIEDIDKYKKLNNNLPVNRLFYCFMLEEIFRKYFGSEIVAEAKYLYNRTPFLSFRFTEQLLQTELCGAYFNFMENNPLNRYKGQIFYSYVIKRSYPVLSHFVTGRGYRPADLLTAAGKLRMSFCYLKRRVTRSQNMPFLSTIIKYFESNQAFWNTLPIYSEYFNKAYFQKFLIDGAYRRKFNILSLILSINYYIYKNFT